MRLFNPLHPRTWRHCAQPFMPQAALEWWPEPGAAPAPPLGRFCPLPQCLWTSFDASMQCSFVQLLTHSHHQGTAYAPISQAVPRALPLEASLYYTLLLQEVHIVALLFQGLVQEDIHTCFCS